MVPLGLRMLRMLFCLVAVLSIQFLLPRLVPGDPVYMLLGPEAAVLSRSDIDALRKSYGLDRHWIHQYGNHWKNLLKGDLGYSFHRKQPVTTLIEEHLSRTLWMVLPAVLSAITLSLLLGTWSGWKAATLFDGIMCTLAVLSSCLPPFLLSMLLLDFFGFHLGWFSLSGFYPTSEIQNASCWSRWIDRLHHLALPVVTLTLTHLAGLFLVMRNATARSRQEPFVDFALARGISMQRVLFVHVFTAAAQPFLHTAALQLGFVVSGAVVVERVFSIPGMGTLILDAASHRDYPLMQGCFLVLSLMVMGLNALIDTLSAWLDPRSKTTVPMAS
uniref:ABC transporter permease n=1 Tax=Desulfatirhabdium butyrativorans TaxID=340467 RepID=A0A7C4MLA7_9BACT